MTSERIVDVFEELQILFRIVSSPEIVGDRATIDQRFGRSWFFGLGSILSLVGFLSLTSFLRLVRVLSLANFLRLGGFLALTRFLSLSRILSLAGLLSLRGILRLASLLVLSLDRIFISLLARGFRGLLHGLLALRKACNLRGYAAESLEDFTLFAVGLGVNNGLRTALAFRSGLGFLFFRDCGVKVKGFERVARLKRGRNRVALLRLLRSACSLRR